MKKLISLMLVLALATVFAAGCKKREEAPKPAPAVEAPKPVMAPMTGKSPTDQWGWRGSAPGISPLNQYLHVDIAICQSSSPATPPTGPAILNIFAFETNSYSSRPSRRRAAFRRGSSMQPTDFSDTVPEARELLYL